jgi:hypothetical protein
MVSKSMILGLPKNLFCSDQFFEEGKCGRMFSPHTCCLRLHVRVRAHGGV